jgi:hypothetical protein
MQTGRKRLKFLEETHYSASIFFRNPVWIISELVMRSTNLLDMQVWHLSPVLHPHNVPHPLASTARLSQLQFPSCGRDLSSPQCSSLGWSDVILGPRCTTLRPMDWELGGTDMTLVLHCAVTEWYNIPVINKHYRSNSQYYSGLMDIIVVEM